MKKIKEEKTKKSNCNWNEQNKKRYLTYLTNLKQQNQKKDIIITHSHWKDISQYIFKQNYKQGHQDLAYDYHCDKLKKYNSIDKIIQVEGEKYFKDKQIQKYIQELKQWQHQKQLAKINWDEQQEEYCYQKNNQNNMKQKKEQHSNIISSASQQRHQDLNNIPQIQQQSNKNQQPDQQPQQFTRTYTINPTLTINQNKNHYYQQNQQKKNCIYYKLFQHFSSISSISSIKKHQTTKTKTVYQFETTVELDLPQILIANNQQTLLKYIKKSESEQYQIQKTKDNNKSVQFVQLQNQYKSESEIKFQNNNNNRLYYISSQINCLKNKTKVKQNQKYSFQFQSNNNTIPKNQTQRQEATQQYMLLKIEIPYILNFQYQFYQQEEDQKESLVGIRNSFINNSDQIVNQQQAIYKQKDKQEKIVSEKSNRKFIIKQSKQKQIKPLEVFWSLKQRLKLLAFIQYHLQNNNKKQMDYMKMATYLPNKKIKNFKTMIDSLRQHRNLKQELYLKKKKLNEKQLEIYKNQMKFLRQLDKEWTTERFLLFKDQVNKIEYLIFNPHFRLPVQKIYEHDFDRSLIYVKNNKRFLKVKYCYKEKEVTTNIQKMDEQKNSQKRINFKQIQDEQVGKDIESSQKKSKGGPLQRWTQLQHIRYLIFLLKNKETLEQTDRWIRKGIYSQMSKLIKSRNVDKCQTKHKSTVSKHGSIQKTIQYLKSTIQNKDLFDKQLTSYEIYLQNNIQQKISYLEHKIVRIGQIEKEFDCKNSKNFRNILKTNQKNIFSNLKNKIKLKLPKKFQKQSQKLMEIKIMLNLNFPIIKCNQ